MGQSVQGWAAALKYPKGPWGMGDIHERVEAALARPTGGVCLRCDNCKVVGRVLNTGHPLVACAAGQWPGQYPLDVVHRAASSVFRNREQCPGKSPRGDS